MSNACNAYTQICIVWLPTLNSLTPISSPHNHTHAAVYMSRHRPLWENSEVFSTTLSQKSDPPQPPSSSAAAAPTTQQQSSSPAAPTSYGPGGLGCTYELCAGIVDKSVSLEQIAKEEVLEETGYDVPLSNMEHVNAYYSSIGHAGSRQTMYYCEVTDDMMVHDGGGNEHEGELIEVVNVPLEDAMKLAMNGEAARSTGLCFAVIWFEHFKRKQLGL